ncbi:MAG: DUF2202 domain-containing protein [Anaerolineales bacterium]|nr:DUF2202 domain-containing protein [Anaerolineales bacterium]
MKTTLFVTVLSVIVWSVFGSAIPAAALELKTTSSTGDIRIDTVMDLDSILSIEEEQGLIYMREEEKLAHDVYVSLYQTWGLSIFQNIANSEATHTSAIKTLLDRYGIADPVGNNPAGVFANSDLQALYTQLVTEGNKSLADALKVGIMIEELDIQDLKSHLAETEHLEIKLVYENLVKGSQNHLRAFTSTLERKTGASLNDQNSNLSAGRGRQRWGK